MRDEYDFSKWKRAPYAKRVKPEARTQADGIAKFLDELEEAHHQSDPQKSLEE